MNETARRQGLRRLASVATAALLALVLVPAAAAPALARPAGPPPAEAGFPLLGWLALAGAVVLALLPLALWLRFARTRRTS